MATSNFVEHQVRHVAVVVVGISAIGGAGLILLGNLDSLQDASIAYVVALAGTVGGTANNYRKLSLLRHVTEDQVTVPRSLVTAQIYLSPLIGAILALVLYAVFLSGILRGEFFPDFACSADPFTNYGDFGDCNPTTHADIALAVLWGFIAGFAEHFVPNILDNLVAETTDADDAANVGEDEDA